MAQYSRRELMKCLAAGGFLIAGELWIPGATKIFLPPRKIITALAAVLAFTPDPDAPGFYSGMQWTVNERELLVAR